MRISELARRSGVSAHRLRRYEALGLLRAERTAGGYRDFAEQRAPRARPVSHIDWFEQRRREQARHAAKPSASGFPSSRSSPKRGRR